MKRNKTIKPYIAQFYKENRVNFITGLISTLIFGSINLTVSWLIGQLIDSIRILGENNGAYLGLAKITWLSVGVVFEILLIKCIDYAVKPKFVKKAVMQYKEYVFRSLTEKSISAFNRENTSAYLSVFTNDVANIERGYLDCLFDLAFYIMLFFGALIMMVMYNPLLTVIACGFFIMPVCVSLFASKYAVQAEKDVAQKNGEFIASLKDCLNGFAAVKVFKAEKSAIKQFFSVNETVEEAKCKKRKVNTVIGTIGAMASVAAQLGTFIAGGYLAVSGASVTPGVLVAFINLTGFVILPVQQLPSLWAQRKAALALVEKHAADINGSVSEKHKEDTDNSLVKGHTAECCKDCLTDKIELCGVSFSYEQDKNVLQNINLTFDKGKCYAIAGPSGSGKSTLLRLLTAEYQGYSGNIYYDGRELRKTDTDSLYDIISVIDQNVFIFNASIRDNITMFQTFDNEDVERAVKLSGLSDLICERGEAYLCGENGSGLSGGEKQRISIARSLLRKSSVLIADEATAALDTQTAYQIFSAILDLNSMTRIVVTHSLEEKLLRRYDGIIALKNGVIEEKGTFDELMDKKGFFYSLYTVTR